MVCSIVGPTNLLDEAYVNSNNQELRTLLDQFGNDQDVLEEVSPLYQVTSTSPPTILFYGAQDPLIPNSQGIALRDKLKELEVIHEFTLYPNGGHGWVGLDLLDTSLKLKAFIQKNLK
nr:prolyl oligopeptidase family serine peptidase [Arenibacter sp. TNZ]